MPVEAELDEILARLGILEAAARRAARYLEEHDERLAALERALTRRQRIEFLEERQHP